ncbi:FG-GAP-like repeat-containing protein [Hymenobacter sp. GOD-10R]|uniref:FG-GAP-like repeat-containing protein n=1 Tax=Hymenobacter sp. GOD-10R TaxID=3093922 RepID=UPI002D79E21A|nr:FG-GAP-like repeat-containing protein [Hymenobacter sp. GOD-10R]WRQ27030.1 FG-GAP-like repeat-containing protein [Hymenobacter sp. GOD-10R]
MMPVFTLSRGLLHAGTATRHACVLGAGLLLTSLGNLASAQALVVSNVTPARNIVKAAPATNVAVTFNQPLSNTAATLGALKVFSQQAGGKKAGTATVSSNTLTFDPNTDFKAGETVYATVTAAAQSSGGVPAAPQVFQFTTATAPAPATFSGPESTLTTSPEDVAVGDLDGDGDLDLATIQRISYPSNNVSIRLNNGTGIFSGGQDLNVGPYSPYKIILGDVDGDGDLDLLISYFQNLGVVTILLNDGKANYTLKQQVSVGSYPVDLAVGDVDADGDLDLLTANSTYPANTASIRLNDGSGTFSSGSEVSVGIGGRTIAVGDVDNDGDLDLLTANSKSVSVRLNNGLGGFRGSQELSTSYFTGNLAVGDIDNDGDLDFVTAGEANGIGTASVGFNDGTGTFNNGPNITLGGVSNIGLGDFEGDGDLDLLVLNSYGSSSVSLQLNNGAGTFNAGQEIPLSYSGNLRLGDLDTDGDLDFLTFTGTTVHAHLNQGAPVIAGLSASSGAAGVSIVLAGTNFLGATAVTFNGIAATSFVVNSPSQITVTVPLGATTGPLVVTTPVGTSNSVPFTVTQDLAVTSVSPARNARSAPRRGPIAVTLNQPLSNTATTLGALKVFSQQADGLKAGTGIVSGNTLRFAPNTDFKAGETVVATLTAAAQSSTGASAKSHVFQFTTATSPSTGVFGGNQEVTVAGQPSQVAAGDIDGDGDLDLLTPINGNTVSVRRNDGNGIFSGNQEIPMSTPAYATLGDIDGDHDLDLVVANYVNNGTVSVRLNDGTGSFSGSQTVAVGSYPFDLSLKDADGDGDLDLFAVGIDYTAPFNGIVSVRLNDGTGSFTGNQNVIIGTNTRGLAVVDVDADGDVDLLACASQDNKVSVRLNNGAGLFSGTTSIPVGNFPTSLTTADVDGDSDLDFMTGNRNSNTVSVRLNNGIGSFVAAPDIPLNVTPVGVTAADVDGDGDPDLLVTTEANSKVNVRVNDGLGSFTGTQEVSVGNTPRGTTVADVDNDGDLDLLVANANANTVSVRLNGGKTLLATTLSPTRNARSASRNTDVTATFNQPLANNAATQGALKVFSRQAGGLKASAATVSGNTLTVNPTTDFKPGETVFATLTKAAQNSSTSLPNAQVFQFTTAVSPSTGTFAGGADVAGAGAVAVGDVDGDGDLDFVNASGGVRLNTGNGRYTNGQQIQITAFGGPVSVTLGDIDGDGDLDLVLNVNPQGVLYVRFNDGKGTFSGTQQIQGGSGPATLVLADVDGDGDLDLLTGNYVSNNTVSVHFNNGQGIFSGTKNINLGSPVNDLAVGDIDNDGDLDFVVPNISNNIVSIGRNDGSGNFSSSQGFAATFAPSGVALGDLDGDGDLDLLTTTRYRYENGQQLNGDVYVSLNDGFGNFNVTQQVPNVRRANRIMLGDVDGDGDLDYVTSGGGVRLNDGTGTFFGNQEVATTGIGFVELADADGDGDLDIFAGGTIFDGGPVTSIRFNQGTTTPLAVSVLSPQRNAPSSPRPTPVSVTFNQALNPDVSQSTVKVFGQQVGLKAGTTSVSGSTLTFAPTADFKPGETVFTTITAARSTSSQALSKPFVFQFTAGTAPATSLFTLDNSLSVGNNPQSVALGDLDGDGDLDLASASNNYPNGTVSIRLGNGNGTFAASQEVPVGWGPFQVVLGDVDNDGDLDLLTANASFPVGTISVRLNNGRGTFSGSQEVLVGNNPHAVALGDVDGDGDLDLLAANYEPASVSIRLNDGAGTFGNGSEVSVGPRPLGLTLGDVDDDGDLDVLTANSFNSTVSLRFNNGNGTYSASTGVEIGVAYNPEALTLGDIDNDGDLDLLTAHPVGSTVSVRFNDGSGSFSGTQQLAVSREPHALALGDTDGDGDLDLLTANYGSTNASLRLNDGLGTFSRSSEVPVGGKASSVAFGDIDGNGALDFVTTHQGANTASVRLNKTTTAAKVLATTATPRNLAEQVALYPNPAHASVRLQLPAELAQQAVQLSVVNTLGQVVLEQKLAARQTALELKLGRLAQGVYNVQLRTASGLVVKRLVVE